jgi:deazaflavin-dependent oxidoreductase (nitroreductase family)
MSGFNDTIIADFRANNGYVEANGFGDKLVLVHSVGAKSGVERVHPLVALRDGSAWLIAASKAGAPEHPAWYYNLLANPSTIVEVGAESGVDEVPIVVTELEGDDRDAAWARFTSAMSGFAAYEESAGDRTIPVLKLTRV